LNAITVEGLGKTFKAKVKEPGLSGSWRSIFNPVYREVHAVAGIDFKVDSGEMLAFIGPNGAGKSTTIKMLTGILHPSAGQAQVLGFVPWKERYQMSFRIGAVFGQRSQLWYHLPPLDTFDLLARIYEIPAADFSKRRNELIERFDLGEFQKTPVRKLSLGQRMRCEVAASLLHRPEVLFLDEPTIGLDVVAKQKIRDLIGEMNKAEGMTVFLTSHDTGDIEQLCKRAIVINHGTIVLDTRVSHLKRDYIAGKIVDLRVTTEVTDFSFPGVTVLKSSKYGLKLSIDSTVQSIDRVLAHLMHDYQVVDITISDPPLEQVISSIYNEGPVATANGNAAGTASGATGDPKEGAAHDQ